jgi:hypothetical protein
MAGVASVLNQGTAYYWKTGTPVVDIEIASMDRL